MPADFHVDAERRVVFSKGTGVLSQADVLDHMDRLMCHPDFLPEFDQLVDFRQLTKVALSSEEVRGLARRKIFSSQSKRAFVVATDLQFGLSRLFATYREFESEKGVSVFREMKEALDWLGLSEEPDRARRSAPAAAGKIGISTRAQNC